MKLVSAVITTHNRLELVKRAIKSVQDQTYKNIELIVVDDASTDGTKEYCEQQPFHFIHIPKEESTGGCHARNLGILAAKGEYVAFLDDDDYWLPQKIEKQVALIESRDCELVYCLRRFEIVKNGEVSYVDSNKAKSDGGDMSKIVLQQIITTTTLVLIKRQALIDVGLFDEKLGFWQEYELTIRLAQRKPFYFVNEILAVYRVDAKDKGRLTNKFYEWKKAVKYIYAKHKHLYAKLNPIERIHKKRTFLGDAKLRSYNAGLTGWYRYYCVATYIVNYPFRVWGWIKRHILHKED